MSLRVASPRARETSSRLDRAEQNALLAKLAPLEAERREITSRLSVLNTEIDALRTELEAGRRANLDVFLQEKLPPLFLTHTLVDVPETDSYRISIGSVVGGELNIARLKALLGSEDTSNVPATTLFSFLGSNPDWSLIQ